MNLMSTDQVAVIEATPIKNLAAYLDDADFKDMEPTCEDFVFNYEILKKADPATLIGRLYKRFKRHKHAKLGLWKSSYFKVVKDIIGYLFNDLATKRQVFIATEFAISISVRSFACAFSVSDASIRAKFKRLYAPIETFNQGVGFTFFSPHLEKLPLAYLAYRKQTKFEFNLIQQYIIEYSNADIDYLIPGLSGSYQRLICNKYLNLTDDRTDVDEDDFPILRLTQLRTSLIMFYCGVAASAVAWGFELMFGVFRRNTKHRKIRRRKHTAKPFDTWTIRQPVPPQAP